MQVSAQVLNIFNSLSDTILLVSYDKDTVFPENLQNYLQLFSVNNILFIHIVKYTREEGKGAAIFRDTRIRDVHDLHVLHFIIKPQSIWCVLFYIIFHAFWVLRQFR